MAVIAPEYDYNDLMEKAKQLSEKRNFLLAQEQSLSKQIEDLNASLEKEFGKDYMALFNEAVEKINAWEKSHAQPA
jgi:flagellar hook-associated protein FlgK